MGELKKISANVSNFILWYKSHIPEASADEVIDFLNVITGENQDLHRWNISRELKSLNFTRKKLTIRCEEADFVRQLQWWSNPPIPLQGFAGCFGVPTQLMIDTDECGLTLLKCNPTYGHSLKGHRARRKLPGKKGISYTVILSVDINIGVVAYWIIPASVTIEIWTVFLYCVLFPRITGQHRYLLWDNLRAHLNPILDDEVKQNGHFPLPRPNHSPHFSFVESCFSLIRRYLMKNYRSINKENFVQFIAGAIATITPNHVQGFAYDAHYLVPNRLWKPWQGE